MSTTMVEIQQLAHALSERMQALEGTLMAHSEEQQALNEKYRERVTSLSALVAASKAELVAAVWKGRALFEKPRSRKFADLVVGLEKSKGRIEFEDEERVVKLIERMFPEMVDVLVITTKRPSKDAIGNLPVSDLKKLGCTVVDSTDQVVVRGVPTDLERAAKAIMESKPAIAKKVKAPKGEKAERRAA